MKKMWFLGLVVIAVLFSACDSKSPIDSSAISKSKVNEVKEAFEPQSFALVTSNEKYISFKSTEEGLDFDEFKGKKAVLIDVFATWCPPCIESVPMLNELRSTYGESFEIVSVLFEQDKAIEEVQAFIKEHGITYPVSVSEEENFRFAKELGDVQKIPEMFLFSKDGKFVKKFVGKVSKEELERYIKIAVEN